VWAAGDEDGRCGDVIGSTSIELASRDLLSVPLDRVTGLRPFRPFRALLSCVEPRVRVLWLSFGKVDSDGVGGRGCARSGIEAFWVCLEVSLQGCLAGLPGLVSGAVVEQGNAGVLVPVVVLGHVSGELGASGVQVCECLGTAGPVLHGSEARLGERVVIGDVRPVVGELDAVPGEVVAQQVRGHRGAVVGMHDLRGPWVAIAVASISTADWSDSRCSTRQPMLRREKMSVIL
jgi:hypothetical protein